jgi:hypothetical protein
MQTDEWKDKAVSASYPPKAGMRVLKTVSEELAVPLTEAEEKEAHGHLLDLHSERVAHDALVANTKAQLKARQAAIESDMAATVLKLTSKVRTTTVEVIQVANFEQGVVQYIRTDSGLVVRTRPLADAERQTPLPMEEAMEEEAGIAPLTGEEGEF